MKVGHALGLAMLWVAGSAFAQVGCPPGYFPIVQGPTGQEVQTCVPEGDAGYGDSGDAHSVPEIRWKDRWGAIAAGDNSIYGIVSDMDSRRQAQKAAIAECKRRGGRGCEVQMAYFNQCAAVIAGRTGSNTFRAATEEKATSMGLKDCEKVDGAGACRVYYSGCSLPVRVQ